jgi:hypothetical protein
VSVVLPASGWEMIATVLRREISVFWCKRIRIRFREK